MLYISSQDFPINKGLLDARNTGRTFHDLSQKFFPVEFFDLCSIIEQMVLRDEIVLVGKFEKLHRSYVNALQPFIDAGVFKICVDAFYVEKGLATDPELRLLARQAQLSGLTSTTLQDGDYAVTRLLGAEISLRIPTVPLLQHLHNYQFFRRPVLDNTVCDLASKYSYLSQRIQMLKEQDFKRLALKPLPIPPMALDVMQRAYNYEKLREQILVSREEFRPLRTEMNRLSQIMIDPSLSSPRFLQITERWEREWQNLASVGFPSLMQLGTSSAQLLEGGSELALAYKSGATLGTLKTGLNLMSRASAMYRKFTLRPVHLSVNNYVRTHPRQMILAASKVFATDPHQVRKQMEAVAGAPSSVWRAALAQLR